jgi:glucan endo-1,3-alpha-glucosidase
MVHNVSPATSRIDFHIDIHLALAHGIDGFALNIGSDDWQEARVADAYAAAQGTKFQLFISFDMAYSFTPPSRLSYR